MDKQTDKQRTDWRSCVYCIFCKRFFNFLLFFLISWSLWRSISVFWSLYKSHMLKYLELVQRHKQGGEKRGPESKQKYLGKPGCGFSSHVTTSNFHTRVILLIFWCTLRKLLHKKNIYMRDLLNTHLVSFPFSLFPPWNPNLCEFKANTCCQIFLPKLWMTALCACTFQNWSVFYIFINKYYNATSLFNQPHPFLHYKLHYSS